MLKTKNLPKRILAIALVLWLLAQYIGSYIPVFAGGNSGDSGVVSGNGDVPADMQTSYDAESMADEAANTVYAEASTVYGAESTVYGAESIAYEEESVAADGAAAVGETEAVPFANGAETQYDLQQYITSVILANADGEIAGDSMIGVRLNFKVPAEIAEDNVFHYNFNDIKAYDEYGNTNGKPAFDISNFGMKTGKVIMDGREVGTYQLNAETGDLEIRYDKEALGPSDLDRNAYFQVSCNLSADAFGDEGGEYELKFTTRPGASNPKVDIKEKPSRDLNVMAKKSHSELNLENRTISYTIEVENQGAETINDLVIHDAFTTVGNEHFTFTGLSGGNGKVTAQTTQNGFMDFVISELPHGTTRFTYTCSFDETLLSGMNNGGTYVNNQISAKQKGDNKPVIIHPNREGEVVSDSFEIRKDIVNKWGSYNEQDGTITWTITINSGSDKYNIAGMKLEDMLSNDDGIPQNIQESAITIQSKNNPGKSYTVPAGNNGFNFTFPTNEGEITDEFQIVYHTKAEFDGTQNFKNKVTATKNGKKLDEAEVSIGSTHAILEKSAVDYPDTPYKKDGNRVTMQWKATVDIPANASEELVFTDKLSDLLWTGVDYDYVLNGDQAAVNVSVDGKTITGYKENTDRSNKYNYHFELTFDRNFVVANRGKTITITYETTADTNGQTDLTFRNTAQMKLGTIRQDSTAERKIKDEGKYIKKGVHIIDEKEHMITWVVNFNNWETAERANWKNDVTFTDTVFNMDFYGCKGVNGDMPREIYIATNNGQSYKIPEGKIQSTRQDDEGGYKTEFSFSVMDAIGIHTWNGDTLADYLEKGEGAIRIYYTTYVPAENLEKYNTVETYGNEIVLSGTKVGETDPTIQSVTSEGKLNHEVLSKECKTPSNAKGNTLEYSIVVNPDGLQLCKPQYAKYKVVDNLPDDLIYKNGSLKVRNSQTRQFLAQGTRTGQYEFYMDENNNMVLMVPDKTPLIITYEVYMLSDADETKDYRNSVIIPEPYVEHASFSQENSSKKLMLAEAGVDGVTFTIEKVNGNDLSEHLPGARFRATEHIWNGSSWIESGVVFEGITDSNGNLSTSSVSSGKAEDHPGCFVVTKGNASSEFENNCYYTVEEIEAPAGYAPTTRVYSVVISGYGSTGLSTAAKNALPKDVNLITQDIQFLFTNVPGNSLTIRKTYWDVVTSGNTSTEVQQRTLFGADAAEIKIYYGGSRRYTLAECQKGLSDSLLVSTDAVAGSGEPLVGDYKVNTTSENNEGDGNTYTLSNIKAGTYTVYESRAGRGYKLADRVYYFVVDNDGNIRWDGETTGTAVATGEIRNYRLGNNFDINKRYLDWEGRDIIDTSDLEQAVFSIQQTKDGAGNDTPDAEERELTVNADGTSYEIGGLEPGTYIIKEKESEIYEGNEDLAITLTVDNGRNITCTVSPATKQDGTITGNGTTEVTACIINQMKDPVNKLVVEKTYTDSDGSAVTADLDELAAATEFKLYKETEPDVYEEVTDADKQIGLSVESGKVSGTVENLAPGSYCISETQTPVLYTPADDVFFTVNGDYTISYDKTKAQECTIAIDNRKTEGDSCLIRIDKKYLNQDGVDTKSTYSTVFVYSDVLDNIKNVTAADLDSPLAGFSKLTTPNGRISIQGDATGLEDEVSYTYYFKEVSNKEGYQITEGYLQINLIYKKDADGSYHWEEGAKVIYDKDGNIDDSVEGINTLFAEKNDTRPDTLTITWNNKANPNKLTLTKMYQGPDGSEIEASSLTTPAVFTLYRKSGGSYTEVVPKLDSTNAGTGTDGSYVIENLNRGDYKLVETAPPGYEKQPDIYFSIGEDYTLLPNAYVLLENGTRRPFTINGTADSLDYTCSVTNVKTSNSFTLTKRLTDYNGDIRRDTIKLDDLEFMVTLDSEAEVPYGDGTMPSTGNPGQFRLNNLEDGTYYIKESKAPSGYIPAGGTIKLVVKDGKIQEVTYSGGLQADFNPLNTTNTLQASAELINHPVDNRITVNKTYQKADGTTIPLADIRTKAVFKLYKANPGGQYRLQETMQPDATGASYMSTNLEPGKYQIKEDSLAGYTPDKAFIAFVVNSNYGIEIDDGSASPEVTGSFNPEESVINTRAGNSFYITKTYINNKGERITDAAAVRALVDGTGFNLYRDNLQGTPVGKLEYISERNRFEVSNLDPGTWYVREDTVPPGYEAASPVRFTVRNDGQITSVLYQGSDGLWATAASTNNGLTVGGTLENYALGNQITITKEYYDSPTSTIPVSPGTLTDWAQFTLYRDYGTNSETDVTDCMTAGSGGSSGKYTFKNMAPGSYTLVEEPMEEFYPASTRNITFTVGNDNKITTTSADLIEVQGKEGYQWSATVRNNRRHNQITLTKEYHDFADNQITDLSTVESYAQFKLYKVAGGEETEVEGKITSTAAAGNYIIKDVSSGTYRIKETVTGYQAVPDIEFTVDADWNITFLPTGADVTVDNGGNDTDRELTVVNHALNGIRIHKTFYDKDGNAMRGTAIFKLWEVQESAGFVKGDAVITDASQSGCNVSALQKDFVSDGKGNYSVRDLPEGIYVITEEENPVYATPYEGWYLYFEVNADKKVCNVEGCFADGGSDGDENGEHPMMGYISYLIDNENAAPEGTLESLMAEASVSNYRLIDENHFILDKRYYDERGQEITDVDTLVEQTEFVLKNSDGKEIPLTYDKETNKYSVTDLLEGVYTLTEVKTPKGFIMASQIMVSVDADAKLHISYTGTAADCRIEGNNSLDGLVTLINREEPKPEDPEEGRKPEDPTKPNDPTNPTAPGHSPAPPQPAIPTSAVKTGDDTPLKAMMATALLTLILGVGCIGLYLRRRRNG